MQILQLPPVVDHHWGKTSLSGLGNSWLPLCFHGYPIHTGLAQRSTIKCASTHGKFMELYWLVVEPTPLTNMKVSWDDYSQDMKK